MIENVDYPRAVIGLIVMIFMYLLSAIRWKFLNQKFSLGQSLNGVIVSKAANTLVPMRGGDMVRAFYLSSVARRQITEVLGTIVIEGATNMVALISLLLVSVFVLGGIVRDRSQYVIMMGVISCLCIYLILYMCRSHHRLIDHYYHGIKFNGKIGRSVMPRIYNFIMSFKDISFYRMFYAQIMSFGISFLGVMVLYIFLTAVSIDVRFFSVVLIFPLMALCVSLPITVGLVGVYDALMVIALSIVGINDPDIVGKVIMVHIFSIVPPTIYGSCLIIQKSMRY